MKFKFYVLNYDFNKKRVEHFNIFRNIHVQEQTEKEIKKYLRNAKNYKSEHNGNVLYGFEALCEEIRRIIMWQEWSRREYEISVSDAFVLEVRDVLRDIDNYSSIEELKEDLERANKNNPKLEKWDCYEQCELNIPIIARECIYQYKQYKKNTENKNE